MGKYRSRQEAKETINRNTVNPYVRGIGCLFMLIVPVFSWFVGSELAGNNCGMGILPYEWYNPTMPAPSFVYQLSPMLQNVIAPIYNTAHLRATIVLGVVTLVIVGGIISIVYGYMYTILAPSKYGPTDVPAPRVKTKKYKR